MQHSEVLVHLGLVDSHPIMSGLDEHDEELTKLHGGMLVLVYGMVGWLSVVTVAAVCIFVGVYVRMSRMSRFLDDAETGSSVSSKSSRFDQMLLLSMSFSATSPSTFLYLGYCQYEK